MRSFWMAWAALGILGLSAPVLPAAHAEVTVIIKRGHDRDWPRWHRRDRDRDEHRIYIERRDDRGHRRRDHDRD